MRFIFISEVFPPKANPPFLVASDRLIQWRESKYNWSSLPSIIRIQETVSTPQNKAKSHFYITVKHITRLLQKQSNSYTIKLNLDNFYSLQINYILSTIFCQEKNPAYLKAGFKN